MKRRDDMVFRPLVRPHGVTSARERARILRRERALRKRSSSLYRLGRRYARRRMLWKSMTKRFQQRRYLGALRGGRGLAAAGRGVARGAAAAGRRAIATPVGVVVAALVVAGAVVLRLGTGMPFEQMSEHLNRMFLGDLDDRARAQLTTRRQLESDRDVLRIIGQEQGANQQINRIFDDILRMKMRREVGASLLRQEFGTNSVIDMLILRAKQLFMQYWHSGPGPNSVKKLEKNYGKLVIRAGVAKEKGANH